MLLQITLFHFYGWVTSHCIYVAYLLYPFTVDGHLVASMSCVGLPLWVSGKESTCNVGDLGLIPGSRRLLWRRVWQPTPVFMSGESHGQRGLVGHDPYGHRVRHD